MDLAIRAAKNLKEKRRQKRRHFATASRVTEPEAPYPHMVVATELREEPAVSRRSGVSLWRTLPRLLGLSNSGRFLLHYSGERCLVRSAQFPTGNFQAA